MRRHHALLLTVALLWLADLPITAQTAPAFRPVAPIGFDTAGPVLRAHTEALKPFTVAGERGVLLGQQDGTLEAWVLPVKLLSHLAIEADIEGYTVPIDVNQQSAEIEVRPDRTVITYAHIGFTVRQIMFSPPDAVPGATALTGPVVLFEFDCLHPTDFTFRFTPNLEYMWPERNEGHPGPEWVAPGPNAVESAGGFYVIHSDYPDLAGAVTIPGARAGILAPFQERPQVHPVELKLHIDPARDNGRLFPLLMAVGTNTAAANTRSLGDTLERLNENIAAAYKANDEKYKTLLKNSVSIETPDKNLNAAFRWAEISIEQLKAKPYCGDSKSSCPDETALVAGYYASGDSARPGFGWFFGRDALYTLYAVNGFGDFGLAKSELEFLIRRQRADGKIMHEYSQTASQIDWKAFPYMYAAADSTPLFLMATLDYVRASGDTQFLKDNRVAIEKAWGFETSHADTNGIYDNRQGTGWVESWPGGMPHQEIYLALLDQQASVAVGQIESLLGDKEKSQSAEQRAGAIATTINQQFPNGDKGCYAFSRNADGSLDRTRTVYPALAWWSDLPGTSQGGTGSILEHGDQCLQQLADASLNTDWGLRDVSNDEKIYDGMSYHQGSVWPLFTGWAAMAEYRGGQPLAGYQMLMENANLTRAQDLGAVTELLSGDFYVPFGRSTSHQLWSSAMVITPVLRGLFGISIDAQTKTITVNPHLPAAWKSATVSDIQLPGGGLASIQFFRKGDHLNLPLVSVSSQGGWADWHLRSDIAGSRSEYPHREATMPELSILTPLVEIDPAISQIPPDYPTENVWPGESPMPGARTANFHILRAENADRKLTVLLEGIGGTTGTLNVTTHRDKPLQITASASGGSAEFPPLYVHGCSTNLECNWQPLVIHLPEGAGWKTITVTLTW